MSEIATTYRDIEILYMETPNRWKFTVNGRERSADSLVKAKESIDRSLDAPVKEKPWQPFEAYLQHRGDWVKVKVTSIAESRSRYSDSGFWVMRGKERSKEPGYNLFEVSPANEAVLAELVRLEAERAAIVKQASEARERLVNIKVPTVESEAA